LPSDRSRRASGGHYGGSESARGQARPLLSLLFFAGTIGTVISCGGGGGDSAGDGGPGLGQFCKALVSVEQDNGVMVGEAETDDTW